MAPLRPCSGSIPSLLPSSKRISINSSSYSAHLLSPSSDANRAYPLPCTSSSSHQVRHATYLRRPKRPYQFTQLVTLSDGSSYLHRTSSPVPIHKAIKDQRNAPLWNPSLAHLHQVEADAAGRLRAFRARFGRGWDMEDGESAAVKTEAVENEREGEKEISGENEEAEAAAREESMLDLIAGFKMNEDTERTLKSKKPAAPVATGGGGKRKK